MRGFRRWSAEQMELGHTIALFRAAPGEVLAEREAAWAVPKETWPIAMCPGCQIQMKIKLIEPAKQADRMDEITYECPKCGTNTKRQFKQPQSPPQSN